jgi:hypothetical protein
MKASIKVEVRDRAQADQIEAGLEAADVRAFALIVGVLRALPTDKDRQRVMDFIAEKLSEGKRA